MLPRLHHCQAGLAHIHARLEGIHLGVCLCAECGKNMHYITDPRKINTYMRCKHHRPVITLRLELIDATLRQYFETIDTGAINVRRAPDPATQLRALIASLKTQIAGSNAALARADDAYLSGHMNQHRYHTAVERIAAKDVELQANLDDAGNRLTDLQLNNKRTKNLNAVRNYGLAMLDNPDRLAANIWLRKHIRIYCTRKEIAAIVIL